jgi:hypothetical protein
LESLATKKFSFSQIPLFLFNFLTSRLFETVMFLNPIWFYLEPAINKISISFYVSTSCHDSFGIPRDWFSLSFPFQIFSERLNKCDIRYHIIYLCIFSPSTTRLKYLVTMIIRHLLFILTTRDFVIKISNKFTHRIVLLRLICLFFFRRDKVILR